MPRFLTIVPFLLALVALALAFPASGPSLNVARTDLAAPVDPETAARTSVSCTLVVKPIWTPGKLPLEIELNGRKSAYCSIFDAVTYVPIRARAVIGRTLGSGVPSGMVNVRTSPLLSLAALVGELLFVLTFGVRS